MTRLPLLIGLGVAALATAAPVPPAPVIPKDAKNLVANGDFEKGEWTPDGWQAVDGLSSYWVKDADPARGKVMKFDTDILQSQGYARWAETAGGAKPDTAPKKIPTVEPKYDTLAGLDGVWFWSDYIPVERGKAYWLTMDVKGLAIFAWLVGYPEKGSTAFGSEAGAFQEFLKTKKLGKPEFKGRNHDPFIHAYKWKGRMDAGGSNEWKTYSRKAKPFRPTTVTPDVKFVRVMIYPYWPPGEYFVDNVRLYEIDDPEE